VKAQGDHHGYASQIRPPLHVETFETLPGDETRLQSPHARTRLRFHVVLATWRRQGVFGAQAGAAIARAWRDLEQTSRFALLKVSFVPDHVHIALNVHPVVAPGPLVVELMNAAQLVIWRDFSGDAIQARIERLWQPSAYVGSYGDLATPQFQAYLRSHRSGESEAG
jgi:REP element-mobilizing transposase RayT